MLQGAQPPPSPHPRSHHHAAHDPAGWAAPGPAGGSRLLIEDSPVEHCLQLGASSAEAPTSLLLLAPPPAFMPSLTDVVVDPEGTARQQRHLQEPAPVREQPGTVLRLEAAVDAAHQVHVLHADRHRPAAQFHKAELDTHRQRSYGRSPKRSKDVKMRVYIFWQSWHRGSSCQDAASSSRRAITYDQKKLSAVGALSAATTASAVVVAPAAAFNQQQS